MSHTSTAQNAIRLLYIFIHGAENVTNSSLNRVGCFEGKAKLHALDFWVRYPDYLAYELLNRFEQTKSFRYLELAEKIIDDQEPDLRLIPMIRYRFGAFDDLNESLSILISKGLILPPSGEKINGKIKNYEYYVTKKAQQLLERISKEFPILTWYDNRARLVCEVAGHLGGAALKEIQYKHMSYADTELGTVIPSIKAEVINRLKKLSKHEQI